MGATNEIKGTNISLKLPDLTCPQCSQKFTEQEIDNRNFDVWFDTSNDVNLEPLAKGYQLSIWIRSIEHENCPETETCQSCYSKFLVEKMINPQGNLDYYCQPCYQLIDKETN